MKKKLEIEYNIVGTQKAKKGSHMGFKKDCHTRIKKKWYFKIGSHWTVEDVLTWKLFYLIKKCLEIYDSFSVKKWLQPATKSFKQHYYKKCILINCGL